jgi:hypothetical protein
LIEMKIICKGEMGDVGRKMIHWLIEMMSKIEMGDVRRKMIYWLIE